MRRVLVLPILLVLGTAALAQPHPYLPPPAPPVLPPPPLQPLPQVKPPEIAIPSAGQEPNTRLNPRPVPRRKGYGDRVVPCIERGYAHGVPGHEMNPHVGRCAGGD